MRKLLCVLTFVVILMGCQISGKDNGGKLSQYVADGNHAAKQGYIIHDSIGAGPMTELVTMRDAEGRLYAKAGRASEGSDYQFIRYLYGDDGKVRGLLEFNVGLNEFGSSDSIVDSSGLIFGTDYERPAYSKHLFERNNEGNIIKVYSSGTDETLTAPSGHHIEYEVKECEDFWSSCLDGGRFEVLFHVYGDK